MPKQLTSQNRLRKEVESYYEALAELVKSVTRWKKDNEGLWNFLTEEESSSPEPEEYKAFVKAWQVVEQAALDANVEGNSLNEKALRALAYNFFNNEERRKYYLSFFNARRTYGSYVDADPVSIIEVEKHYQYYCYRNRRRLEGLGLGPVYKRWKSTEDCATFYDKL